MNPMNGILLVDKPTGMTSHDVVYKTRRILGIRGIGHAGTLDPLASGLLILLIGEATKVSDYLLNGDKSYEVAVRLGVTTDSMDITGKVLNETPAAVVADVSPERIGSVVTDMSGTLRLEVPVHSAVKVDGKKLYEFAHKGERPPEVPERDMHFYGVQVLSIEAGLVCVRLSCAKGGFIRAWAGELGRRLGCGACVEELRRIKSAPFEVGQSIGIEQLEKSWNERDDRHGSVIGPAWIPLRDCLPHFRRLDVNGHDERLLKNGQISNAVRMRLLQFVQVGTGGPVDFVPPPVRVIAGDTDDLLALLVAEPGEFYKIKRVFHRA